MQIPDRPKALAKRCGVVLLCVAAAAMSVAATAWSARPRRWSAPFPTMTRDEVHALLGHPDADFSAKGWDGWDQPALVGAWVLQVFYAESGAVVASRTKFDWGLGYLRWDRMTGAVLRTPRDWAFVQSVGGLALGTPYRTASGVVMLPVAVDVSGLRAITTKPVAMNSGLVLDGIRVRRDGHALGLTLVTTPAGAGPRRTTSLDVALGPLEAGSYAVDYVEPDGRRVALGDVTVR